MEKFYKSKIYQNQIVQERDRTWFKDMALVLMLTVLIAGAVLFYVWQQVEMIKFGYKIEQMKEERNALQELNRELKLERSYLRRLERIESIAKQQLHMKEPDENCVIIIKKQAEKDKNSKDSKNKTQGGS
jgi:cell division protein FtsL